MTRHLFHTKRQRLSVRCPFSLGAGLQHRAARDVPIAPTSWHAAGEHRNATTVPISLGVAQPRANFYSAAGVPGW